MDEKIMSTLTRLEDLEKRICEGEIGSPTKQILRDAIEIIRYLSKEKFESENKDVKNSNIDYDPYEPLWPNREEWFGD